MEKITMPQAESRSADLISDSIEQLKQIFPEVIKEGRVDFEALNDLLGNYIDGSEERFGLNWAGKANARREAQKRSSGTLRPCLEESVDWDTTENLYIEGDNLEVLKLLQKSYHSKIKMIYIDPPYNTGKDFVYKDNYVDNMQNYLELTGQDKKMSTNTESDGRYHSNWLNMMYPRLKLARNLLTDDGVIFISIDDNEVDNLKKICGEIFGEENFVASFIWEKRLNRENRNEVSVRHDYVICFSKNTEKSNRINLLPMTEQALANYSNPDNDIRGLWKSDPAHAQAGHGTKSQFYILTAPNGKKHELPSGRCWLYTKEVMDEAIKDNRIWFGRDGNGVPRIKTYLNAKDRGLTPETILFAKDASTNEKAKNDLKNLFDGIAVFDTPKPIELIQILDKMAGKSGIILDFFSGAATVAHSVMQLNEEDGGTRKYICVQIPEATPEDSEARKAKYNTIPEIAKERIRRAGKKILEEQKNKNDGLFAGDMKKLDIGFKVFKLDSSNINAWDSNPDNLEATLNNSLFNIKEDRTEDDLLYEILIKYGIELTQKINRHTIAGKTVYEMGAGSLVVCLADNITTNVAEGIGKLWKEVSPEDENVKCRVVFKDSGFNGSDLMKTNMMLILKQHGITNIASV